jgi:hypothetical protein
MRTPHRFEAEKILFNARREMLDLAALSQDPFILEIAGVFQELEMTFDAVIEGDINVSDAFRFRLEVES